MRLALRNDFALKSPLRLGERDAYGTRTAWRLFPAKKILGREYFEVLADLYISAHARWPGPSGPAWSLTIR